MNPAAGTVAITTEAIPNTNTPAIATAPAPNRSAALPPTMMQAAEVTK